MGVGRLRCPTTIIGALVGSGVSGRRIRRGGRSQGGFDLLCPPPRTRAGAYGPEHRDPFDRMLAAQALVEGLTLMSKDGCLRGLGPRRCGRRRKRGAIGRG